MTARPITRALAAYRRRGVVVIFVRTGIVSCGLALVVAELAALRPDLFGHRAVSAAFAVMLLAVTASAAYARTRMPSATDAARRIDRTGGLEDLIVTAVEREPLADAFSAAITRAAGGALPTVPPHRAYPLEPPRRWRRWALVAAAAQVVAIALAWQSPAARPLPPSGLSLPSPGGAAGSGAPGESARASAQNATPAGNAATDASQALPATASTTSASPSTADRAPAPAASRADAGSAAGDTPRTIDATGRGSSDASNRARQGADRAAAASAQRRVPVALRGIVERYFAAIRQQGK